MVTFFLRKNMEKSFKEEAFKKNLGDWKWRINNLYYIINKEGIKVKFVMNEVQNELFDNMHYRNVVLKARQFGITTFACILFLDRILFRQNLRCGIIAQTQTDAEVFFRDKIKYAYENLPDAIKRSRPLIKDTGGELILGHNGKNLNNSSGIRVACSMRSGTLQYLHISEFGKICATDPKKTKEVISGSLNTLSSTSVCIIESTAEGNYGKFFDICQEAMKLVGKDLSTFDFKFFFFPWWKMSDYETTESVVFSSSEIDYFIKLQKIGIDLSPEKKFWYVRKSREQGDAMKQEFPSFPDEAFEQSIDGAYYLNQIQDIYKSNRIGDFPCSLTHKVNTAWDIGYNDDTSIWFFQKIGDKYYIIDHYANNGEGLEHYVKVLENKNYIYETHFAPHDINQGEFGTGITRAELAIQKYGLRFTAVPKISINQGIENVRQILPKCFFHEQTCKDGLKHLQNYRKLWDEKHGMWSDRPYHDECSHDADSFRYLATGIIGFEDTGFIGDNLIERCVI